MLRSLTHFWRLHLAVLLGAAVATTVLTGSLAVGDSMRASLRQLWLERLGDVEFATAAPRFFRAALAEEVTRRLSGGVVAPIVILRGSAEQAATHRRVPRIAILGVDGRFAALYGGAAAGAAAAPSGILGNPAAAGAPPAAGAAAATRGLARLAINETLAQGLGARPGDEILLAWEQPSAIPREMLLAAKEPDAMLAERRFTVGAVVPDRGAGSFALAAGQATPPNAFLPLAELQRALGEPGAANGLLAGRLPPGVGGRAAGAALAAALRLADLGLTLRPLGGAAAGSCGLVLESREVFLPPAVAAASLAAAAEVGAAARPVLTYLAIGLAAHRRSIPYSMVSALGAAGARAGALRLASSGAAVAPPAGDGMLLDDWAAEDLAARPGDSIEMTYFLPESGSAGAPLETARATFRLDGVVALEGLAADRGLTPAFPGIDQAREMASWSPPFPVDLRRVRPRDETFWRRWGPTPKAFVGLDRGRQLWGTRFGDLTSLRLACPAGAGEAELAARFTPRLLARLRPESFGLALRPVRAEGLAAASLGTDFGALYVSFSSFLIAAAALLCGLLFALGVERRAAEAGLLLALGYRRRAVRRRFLGEGLALAGGGALLGLAGAGVYTRALLGNLRAAAGMPRLSFAVSAATLAWGWLASVAAVQLFLTAAVRRLTRLSAPRLLAGTPAGGPAAGSGRRRLWLWLTIAAAAALVASGIALAAAHGGAPGLAFGVALSLLVAGLGAFALWCVGAGGRRGLHGGLLAMGLRNTAANPGRSLLCVALVACATLTLVMVAANRRGGGPGEGMDGGWAGWNLVGETTTPLYQDLASSAGRAALGFSAAAERELAGCAIAGLSEVAGDDASCRNLYLPRRPRLLGMPPRLAAARLTLASGHGSAAEIFARAVRRGDAAGVVPAIGDEQSVRWVLHKDVGDEVSVASESGAPLRLRIAGLLAGSPLQDALLIPEAARQRYFPRHGGRAFFLVRTPPGREEAVAGLLAGELADFGFAAQPVAERLRLYAGVEETYLGSFQALGSLGLLLGTCGLAVVLLRSAVERRWELAMLRALGFRRRRLAALLLLENAALLALGLALGTAAGLLPEALGAGLAAAFPWRPLAATLALIVAAGALASGLAVAAALAAPLVPALKTER